MSNPKLNASSSESDNNKSFSWFKNNQNIIIITNTKQKYKNIISEFLKILSTFPQRIKMVLKISCFEIAIKKFIKLEDKIFIAIPTKTSLNELS